MTVLVGISLIAASCGGGDADPEPTETSAAQTTSSSTTSTIAATTTSEQATTSVTQQLMTVTSNLTGDGDNALHQAIVDLYAAAFNPGQAVYPDIPAGLLEQFADREPQYGTMTISGDVYTSTILDTEVAIALSGDDVVLAAIGPDDQWDIVGAKLTSLDEPAWYGESPMQILVIGSDARPGGKVEGHRADSVHIVSAVPAEGIGSIVGIPRDTWVEVSYEGYDEVNGMDKLTHTMASKGPEFVVEAVTTLSGVEFDGYLLTGFAGFEDLIDAFGGVNVNVPYRMNDIKSFSNLFPGEQLLDGADSLAFNRNRANAPGGDFGRSFNHGEFMKAVLFDMQDRGGLEQVPMLLSILTEYVQTDMSAAELLNMAAATFEVESESVPNLVVPGYLGWASQRSVVLLEEEAFEIFADVAEDGILSLTESDG